MLAKTPYNGCREELMRKNSPSAPSRVQSPSKIEKLNNPSTDDPGLSEEERKRALDTWDHDSEQ
jgi:hypothetical protein